VFKDTPKAEMVGQYTTQWDTRDILFCVSDSNDTKLQHHFESLLCDILPASEQGY
jgi:hypothetical protein